MTNKTKCYQCNDKIEIPNIYKTPWNIRGKILEKSVCKGCFDWYLLEIGHYKSCWDFTK